MGVFLNSCPPKEVLSGGLMKGNETVGAEAIDPGQKTWIFWRFPKERFPCETWDSCRQSTNKHWENPMEIMGCKWI